MDGILSDDGGYDKTSEPFIDAFKFVTASDIYPGLPNSYSSLWCNREATKQEGLNALVHRNCQNNFANHMHYLDDFWQAFKSHICIH